MSSMVIRWVAFTISEHCCFLVLLFCPLGFCGFQLLCSVPTIPCLYSTHPLSILIELWLTHSSLFHSLSCLVTLASLMECSAPLHPLILAKSFQLVYPPLSAAPTHKRHNLEHVLDSYIASHVSFKSTNQCPASSFDILNSNQSFQPTSSTSCCLHSRCLHFPNTQESPFTPSFIFWDPSCLQSVNSGSKIPSTKFQKETHLKF